MNRRSRFCRPMPYHLAMSPRKFLLERETGFEPATSTLARLHSTTELLPRGVKTYIENSPRPVNRKNETIRKFFQKEKKEAGTMEKAGTGYPAPAFLFKVMGAYSDLLSALFSASSSAASFFSSSSRRARRRTLPTRVLGSSSRNSKTRGTL